MIRTWNSYQDTRACLIHILDDIREDRLRYQLLSSTNGDPGFAGKCLDVLYEESRAHLERNLPGKTDQERQMVFRYMTGGLGGVLLGWFREGMAPPVEPLVDCLIELTKKTLQSP